MVNVDWVISMLDLRQLLPRAIFETCFTGEGVLLLFFLFLKVKSWGSKHINKCGILLSFSLSGWLVLQSV